MCELISSAIGIAPTVLMTTGTNTPDGGPLDSDAVRPESA
jgi:hypothetical protein